MKTKVIRVISVVLMLVSIVLAAVSFSNIRGDGEDFTKEYRIYQDIKDFTTVAELKSHLQEQQLEYTIENKLLVLNKYENIEFSITMPDKTCSIKANDLFKGFEKLDAENYAEVRVDGKMEKGKIVETVTFEDGFKTYRKVAESYKYNNSLTEWIVVVICIAVLTTAIVILIKSFFPAGTSLKKTRLFEADDEIA